MFNIGIGELLVVLIVAFVVVGPDDLPKVARWMGRQIRCLKRLIKDLKTETGFDEIEREVRDVQQDVRRTVNELDISEDINVAAKALKDETAGVANELMGNIEQLNARAKQGISDLDDEYRDTAKQKKEK